MKYITYLTIYSGTKLPPFYIGSTSLEKHLNGYNGTILSQKYKSIYKQEQKENPHLFDSLIIEEFETREEATDCERYYQLRYDVVQSALFFNMAIAAPDGYFGRDTAGINHPLYGSHNCKGNVHSHNPITGEAHLLPIVPEGCIAGRPPNYKASSHNKGKKWYNNGTRHQMFNPEQVPPGWVKGKLSSLVSTVSLKMWERKRNENSNDR